MGKLVKYCGDCEEGFAERFGFCPNCGGQLEAFELNPVAKMAETAALPATAENFNASNFVQAEAAAPVEETLLVPETTDFSDDDILELDSVDTRESVVEKEPETLAETVASVNESEINYQFDDFSESAKLEKTPQQDKETLGDYHVTVVSEKASNWFQPFLLSLMGLAFLMAISSYAIGIWIHGFQIPEIDGVNEVLFSNLLDDNPLAMEEKEKKVDKNGGGGGGGGNENPDPASRGRIPTNGNPTPLLIAPRFDSDIKINNRVQSNVKMEDDGQVIGGGNADGVSSGSGKGKGIGTGIGTGIGSGEGTGVGSGRGSGTGNGIGNGNGDGLGDGDLNETQSVKIKEKPVGVTQKYKIISKPQARYTDAARQNNVQGTVTVKVTLLASGQVGGVTAVNSLPYGLTEQAIAAAKSIKFEPTMKNGVAQTTVATIQYSFTIY